MQQTALSWSRFPLNPQRFNAWKAFAWHHYPGIVGLKFYENRFSLSLARLWNYYGNPDSCTIVYVPKTLSKMTKEWNNKNRSKIRRKKLRTWVRSKSSSFCWISNSWIICRWEADIGQELRPTRLTINSTQEKVKKRKFCMKNEIHAVCTARTTRCCKMQLFSEWNSHGLYFAHTTLFLSNDWHKRNVRNWFF